jgi:hypothetical protein
MHGMAWVGKKNGFSVKKARSSYRCYRIDISFYKVVLSRREKKERKEGKNRHGIGF